MPIGGGGDRYWVAEAEATGTGGGGDSGQTARERRRGREMRAKGYLREICAGVGFFFIRGIFVTYMMYVEWVASPPTQNQ
jgi:hypothetical protein